MDLTEDEVREILKLLEESSFDFMQLEVGDVKLTVSKSGYVPDAAVRDAAPAAAAAQIAPAATASSQPSPAAGRKTAAVPEGMVPVPSPMVGTFYAAPEPGAAPFVEAGARVDEDTTVGLIETMKVFTAVKAGVRGVIGEILVANAEAVEYGQILILVRPDAAAAAAQ